MTSITLPVVAQEQTARDFDDNQNSSATQPSRNLMADDAELCDHRQSNESETPEQPPQTSRVELTGEIVSLPGAVEAINAIIKKISINERDMKTLLEQTKSVLESKLSEIDQCFEKADTITTNVDSTTRSLVELQRTYTWLQVKLQEPPSVPLGACSLCQRHPLQIRQHRGYSSMRNWLNCSVVLDSDHRMQKVKQHEQSECHKICKSADEQRKRMQSFSRVRPISKKKKTLPRNSYGPWAMRPNCFVS